MTHTPWNAFPARPLNSSSCSLLTSSKEPAPARPDHDCGDMPIMLSASAPVMLSIERPNHISEPSVKHGTLLSRGLALNTRSIFCVVSTTTSDPSRWLISEAKYATSWSRNGLEANQARASSVGKARQNSSRAFRSGRLQPNLAYVVKWRLVQAPSLSE